MAGVREPVGREGLQRFMGEKSEAVTSRVGGLICKILGGFLAFPELCVATVLMLLTEVEIVSMCSSVVSAPLLSTLSCGWLMGGSRGWESVGCCDEPESMSVSMTSSWDDSTTKLGEGLVALRSGRVNCASVGRICSNE